MKIVPEKRTTSGLIEDLASTIEWHERLFSDVAARATNDLHPVDHVIAAVLRRSMSLIRGFLLLADQGNEFAAVPLIRLQLDNVLRVSAFRIVDDPFELGSFMLGNKPLQNFKHRKQRLTDKFLRDTVAGSFRYLDESYELTSGYVHLSIHHLVRVIDDWKRPDRKEDDPVSFGCLSEMPAWDPVDKREAVLLLLSGTIYLLKAIEAVRAATKEGRFES
jgi:hypothetical protein